MHPMSKNILIAALGDHPTVVTAIFKALREIARIRIDVLHVLYPEETGKNIAQLGYPMIEEHLQEQCEVYPVPLPFSDSNTRGKSVQFLRILAGLMSQYQDKEAHNVYFSLAGGRKNMSALMALVTQFFPSVKGLYHLIDKEEEKRSPAFPSIEELLERMPEIEDDLDPPCSRLELVSIPYPGGWSIT
jgi:CRISPR-associated Csx14 family protein